MSERPTQRWTLMLVPDDGTGEVRQIKLELRALQRALMLGGGLLGLLLALAIGAIATLPATLQHGDLVAENQALRGRLHDIEGQLDEIDGTLQRVRFYDAHLRRLVEETPNLPGGFGPLDDEEAAILGIQPEGSPEELAGDHVVEEDHEGWDDAWEHEGPRTLSAEDLRPAEAWAQAVQARTEDSVGRLQRLELRMAHMAEDMEDLFSIKSAYPSVFPVDGSILTSGFGYRSSPITGRRKLHTGIDLSAARGTPVKAVGPGTVVMAMYNSGYGRMVEIDHGIGIISRYAHNASVFVKQGDKVEGGQVIATVGTTGQTTGPHLHFELVIDEHAVDPLEYLPRP